MFETKNARRGAFAIFCGAVFFAGATAPALSAPPKVLQDTYVTAVIGDLPAMVNRGAELGNRINPGITGQALRGQIGMFLGDAGMKSIPAGSGLLIAVPANGSSYALLETESGKNGTLADVLQRRGRMAVKASGDNLVLIAKNTEALNSVDAAQTSAAAQMLKASNDPFLQITLDTDKLAREKGPDFKRALKNIADKVTKTDPGSTGTAQFLNLFGNFVLAVGQRSDVATIKIDVSADGILIDRSVYPIGGLQLAQPEGPTGEELRKGLVQPNKVAANFDFYLDTQSAIKALEPFFNDVVRGANFTAQDRAELKNILDKAAAAYGDGFAGWSSLGPNGTSGAFIITVDNPEAAAAEIEAEMSSFTSGTMAKFSSDLGIQTSMSLQRNAETVAGQPVTAFSMEVTGKGGKGAKLLSNIYDIKSGKFMFLEDKMLLTMGDASLEELATASANGSGNAKPVQAHSKLDKGGFVYADFYPAALAELPGTAKLPLFQKLLGAMGDGAIYQSGYVDQERIRAELLIPGDMIENLAKTVQKIKRNSTNDSKTTGSM